MARFSQKRKKLRHRRHQAEFNTLRKTVATLRESMYQILTEDSKMFGPAGSDIGEVAVAVLNKTGSVSLKHQCYQHKIKE
jgi:hypothetical protein|tara:strand:+ start:1296 stop:1535 length:240 start_codon:yes stop_codon:yes gene_type:complete